MKAVRYIYTARCGISGLSWRKVTEDQLRDWNVKYHKLFMGKPAADAFIDDKGIHITVFMDGTIKTKTPFWE